MCGNNPQEKLKLKGMQRFTLKVFSIHAQVVAKPTDPETPVQTIYQLPCVRKP